jgi:hypothetical protein
MCARARIASCTRKKKQTKKESKRILLFPSAAAAELINDVEGSFVAVSYGSRETFAICVQLEVWNTPTQIFHATGIAWYMA